MGVSQFKHSSDRVMFVSITELVTTGLVITEGQPSFLFKFLQTHLFLFCIDFFV